MPTTTCAADFITQSLVDAGVRTVFGGHGGALVPLVNSVCEHPQLKWICTRNEANASLMAAADSKLSGNSRLAACIATSGPGASNLVTGLLDAQLDRVPLIAITGTKPRSDAAHSEFQDIDQSRLFAAGGLAYSVTVSDKLQLVAVMRDAVAIALTQRVCVHIAVPVDIQGMQIQAPEHLCSAQPEQIRRRTEGESGPPQLLDDISAILASPDERVVIAVGLDARHAGKEILALAEALNAPVVTRLDAKGTVDEGHPLSMGVIGVHGKPGLKEAAGVVESSTLVLALGVLDLHVCLCDPYGMQVREMIEVALDTYGISTRFRAKHTLIANPALVCKQLRARLQGTPRPVSRPSQPVHLPRQLSKGGAHGIRLWNEQLKTGRWRSFEGLATPIPTGTDGGGSEDGDRSSKRARTFCHPGELLRGLNKYLRETDVLCVDTGDITLWASLCICLRHGTTTLSSERLGTMGYALCAGIAASIDRGTSSKAVVVVGDGGFQMTMNELGTAMQHGANLLVIVIDNGVLGRVEFGFDDAKGCTISGCDWVALAKAYGADGIHVRSNSEITAAIELGMASKGVFVLAAETDPSVKADMAKTTDAKLPYWLTAERRVDSG